MLLNLKMEMEKNHVTVEKMAQLLDLHRNTISSKLSGETEFSIAEAFEIRERLFPYADMQYLFKQIYEVSEQVS